MPPAYHRRDQVLLATVRKANDAGRHKHLPTGEPLPWFLVNTKLLSNLVTSKVC